MFLKKKREEEATSPASEARPCKLLERMVDIAFWLYGFLMLCCALMSTRMLYYLVFVIIVSFEEEIWFGDLLC